MKGKLKIGFMAFAILLLAGLVHAFTTITYDDTGDAITAPGGIAFFSVSTDGSQLCMYTLSYVPITTRGKFRLHVDYDDGDLAIDNAACQTTSDFTFTKHWRNGAWWKNTGSSCISYSTMGLSSGATVYVWMDSLVNGEGIVDRAPNTNGADSCSKPQLLSEVVPVTLE
jgi:hypothetical protein